LKIPLQQAAGLALAIAVQRIQHIDGITRTRIEDWTLTMEKTHAKASVLSTILISQSLKIPFSNMM